MVIQQKLITANEFAVFIQHPENADRLFELVNGEIIEKVPGRTRYSEFSHIISAAVRVFCKARSLPCHTSGGDGAYRILDHVIAPDFAYKPTPMSEDYPDPVPPVWAVEIISPTDKVGAVRAKRRIYREAGILLWELYREEQTVDVYVPDQMEPVIFSIDDTLDGGDVLPGFTLSVREIFTE